MALSPRARSSIQLTNRYPRAPPYFRMLRPSSDATVAIMATSAELKDARSRMFDRSLNTATCRSTSARMSNRPSVVRFIVFCGSGRSQLEQCVFGRKGDGIALPFPSRWRSYAAWHTQPHQTQRSCVDPDQVWAPSSTAKCSGRSVSTRGPKQPRTLLRRASPTGQWERKVRERRRRGRSPARASNVPEFDVLCISGIIQNCSWNQPNRGAQFRPEGKRGDQAWRLCVRPLSRRAPPRGVPASKPLSQRGVA